VAGGFKQKENAALRAIFLSAMSFASKLATPYPIKKPT
jgi:hypothetical protein